MNRLGATLGANVLTAAFVGAFAGVLALPACSPKGASNPDEGNGGGSQGARPGGGGANSPAGGTAGNNVGGSGNNNPAGGFGNGGVGPGNGGDNPGGFVGSGGDINPGAGGSGPKVWTDPDAANGARNQVPAGHVCDRLSTIQCAGEAYCCDAPGRTYDQCKQTTSDACANGVYLDAVTADPKAGYDTAGAAAIFLKYEQLASACDPTVTSWGASLDGLRGLVKGTVQSGQSCEPPLTQLTNKPVAAAHLTYCANPQTTACFPTALNGWTCTQRADVGGSCFTDTNCNDGLYCDPPDLTIANKHTCKLRKADGSPCTLGNECGSLLCKQSQCASVNQQTAFCLN